MADKLFGVEYFDESYDDQQRLKLLQTIKVPKNLLYLTDRLPKPSYDSYQRAIK